MGTASPMDGQIIRQSSSYRQGLVLGLTMAEIMILLVFCLLIALATFLKMEQVRRAEAEAARATAEQAGYGADQDLVEAIRRNPELAERLKSLAKSGSAAEVDKYWRELVEAKNVVAAAKERGLSEQDIQQALVGTDTAARNADIVRSIEKVMSAGGEPATTPGDIAKVVERGMHPWPPIIKLSEADGYYFETGSAQLRPDFRAKLADSISEQILAIIKQYDVDVVEVVGHTDEQPVGSRPSNLDRDLVSVLRDNASITSLVPADNAGLGLARAASVVSALLQSPQLAAYKLIPLSGAQLVNVDESLALSGTPGDIRERRRIEIRLRKSARQQGAVSKVAPTPLPVPRPRRRPSPNPVPPSTPENAAGSLNMSREH
jgi:outer membrane protein OmpA-like peptidoglycan-associated protein